MAFSKGKASATAGVLGFSRQKTMGRLPTSLQTRFTEGNGGAGWEPEGNSAFRRLPGQLLLPSLPASSEQAASGRIPLFQNLKEEGRPVPAASRLPMSFATAFHTEPPVQTPIWLVLCCLPSIEHSDQLTSDWNLNRGLSEPQDPPALACFK